MQPESPDPGKRSPVPGHRGRPAWACGGSGPAAQTSRARRAAPTPPPRRGGPTAAELLAKMVGCNAIGGPYRTDQETPATIAVCGAKGAVFWRADMDIDCDGVTTPQCNIDTDPAYQDGTSLETSTGQPFNAATMPFVVIPSISSRWSYDGANIQLGAVAAVIFNGEGGVRGVRGHRPGGDHRRGSYAMASRLGIDRTPRSPGRTGSDVRVFPGSRVSPWRATPRP